MARKLRTDRVLFIATFLLVCTSIVMVYSASGNVSLRNYGDEYHIAMKQMLWAALGMALLSIVMRIDYRTYQTDAFAWCAIGIVGLLLVAVPSFGPLVNGSRRWLSLAGMRLQPSELAKLSCVMFTALVLQRRMHRINEVSYSLLPIGIVVGAVAALILAQPDFGTSVSLVVIVGTMIFAAGLRYQYLVSAGLAMLPLLFVAVKLASYRDRRWTGFVDPWSDPLGAGYQPIQSMIAVGTGGLFGKGLNQSVQKQAFLPESHNDFLFAVITEELGFIGAVGILLCFCVIAWRGLRIAARAEDAFGALVGIGITTMVCTQALVNMSVVLNLLPTKGIPLPFLSYGGSSLVVCLLGVGVLLNISQHETARV